MRNLGLEASLQLQPDMRLDIWPDVRPDIRPDDGLSKKKCASSFWLFGTNEHPIAAVKLSLGGTAIYFWSAIDRLTEKRQISKK